MTKKMTSLMPILWSANKFPCRLVKMYKYNILFVFLKSLYCGKSYGGKKNTGLPGIPLRSIKSQSSFPYYRGHTKNLKAASYKASCVLVQSVHSRCLGKPIFDIGRRRNIREALSEVDNGGVCCQRCEGNPM